MEIILTHEQADFDAAGSVLAAWLLDPSRVPVLPKRRNRNLAAFIEDYKSRLPFFTWQTLPKGPISRVYITDTQTVAGHSRLTGVKDVVVWDHHPCRNIFPDRDENIYDPTGSCTTFLVEKLAEKPSAHPGRIFSTLMLMGIYEDTGSLSYGSTTPRDIRAAAWLVERGADLDLMRRYILQPMTDHQQQGCDLLLRSSETYEISGEQIIIASADIREISDEFSAVAHQLRDMLNPDGLVLLLAVKNGVRMICRATTDDIDFGDMMRHFNGGGHARAASCLMPFEYMEETDAGEILDDVRKIVLETLPDYIRPPKLNLADRLSRQMAPEQLELIRQVAETAEQMDMPVYIVGGVVRDLLLGHPIMDFDIVAEGDAMRLGKQAAERFGGHLVLHRQFYTAKWELPDRTSLDLISARSESYSAPAALPDVEMGSMEDDLLRRDFTLNTLAVRLDGEHYGELLDLCSGLQDLRRGLIRTLHDRSFIDDPTRIFRAIRFEQRFDFELEGDTLRQLREQMGGISLLTGQRIWHELQLYCAEPYPEDDFARISYLGIAAQILPGLIWNEQTEADCIRYRIAVPADCWQSVGGADLSTALEEGPLWTWLSALDDEVIADIGERLLLPKKTLRAIQAIALLRRDFPAYVDKRPSEITFFLEKLPPEALYCYARFCPDETEKALLEKHISVRRNIAPAASGDDLLRKGITPGPGMREILTELRAAWLDGEIRSADEENSFIMSAAGKQETGN